MTEADVVPMRSTGWPALFVALALRRRIRFMAKSELFENRHFGWLIRSLNAFPVRQGEGDVGAVKETIRRLQEGHALIVYPEGTRSLAWRLRFRHLHLAEPRHL